MLLPTVSWCSSSLLFNLRSEVADKKKNTTRLKHMLNSRPVINFPASKVKLTAMYLLGK